MKTFYPTAAFLTLLAGSLHLSALAAVTAQLDRGQISLGESVRLILQHEGNTHRQPDLNPLKQDFDILSRSSGSTIQIINGQVSSKNQITMILAPKREGRIQIPALEWDGERSAALALTVSSAATHPNTLQGNHSEGSKTHPNAAQHVFLTSTVDQKQPYVQAAVTLTVKLYTDRPLYEASIELPPNNDVIVQPLGKDQQTSEVRNGKSYQVVERKYLLFPQRSGQLKLAGPVLNATVADTKNDHSDDSLSIFGSIFGNNPLAGMMAATRPIQLRSNAMTLNVQARHASSKGDWLPAQQVMLEESWLPDTLTAHAGEPIVRHLSLSAIGLTAAQLPDVTKLMPLPPDLKMYPDQPKLENSVQHTSIVGRRQHDVALIANRPGKYTLPAVHMQWWDTVHNIQREVVLPSRTLNILPGSSNSPHITAQTPQNPTSPDGPQPHTPEAETIASQAGSSSSPDESTLSKNTKNMDTSIPWHWVSLGLGTLWLTTLAAWWYKSKRSTQKNSHHSADALTAPSNTLSATEARKSFQQACQNNTPQPARHALLAWASATWPDNPPTGLNALVQRLNDSQLSILLRDLDRACYTSTTWEGNTLANTLTKLPTAEKNVTVDKSQLGALYP